MQYVNGRYSVYKYWPLGAYYHSHRWQLHIIIMVTIHLLHTIMSQIKQKNCTPCECAFTNKPYTAFCSRYVPDIMSLKRCFKFAYIDGYQRPISHIRTTHLN